MPDSFSIITICFNNPAELLRTMASVDSQTLKPTEHIIVNGSTEPEIQKILTENTQPPYRKAIHERDKGIADAFNKGIAHATGNILLMLNAGDELAAAVTLQIVDHAFQQHPGITWLHGRYRFQRGGIWVVLGKPYQRSKLYRGMRSICHQTMYIRKTVYEKIGGYSTDFPICMDYDLLVRMRDEPFVFLDDILATFAPGGISMQRSYQILKENTLIYRRHIGYSFWQSLWHLRLHILIGLMNSPLGKLLYRIKVWLGLENM